MLKFFIYFLFFLVPTNIIFSQEEKDIKQTVENYKQNLLSGDGEAAVNWLNKNTFNYYKEMLDHALYTDSLKIDQLPLMDKLMTFSLRHRVAKDTLLSFTGKTAVIYAINNGWIGEEGTRLLEVGEVSIEGQSAKAEIVVNNTKSPFHFNFDKEDDIWKLDLVKLTQMAAPSVEKTFSQMGEDVNQSIFQLLEMVSGNEVSKDIWEPLVVKNKN